jgi:hypothetical protein
MIKLNISMEILKKAVVFLSGVIIYLFIFLVIDYFVPGTYLSNHYTLTAVLAVILGFCLNLLINRFLFGFCIIRSVLYSFYSILLLILAVFIIYRLKVW